MLQVKSPELFNGLDQMELRICLFLNRSCHRRSLRNFFSIISRLGNGIFWYGLMLALPLLGGIDGLYASLHMLGVGMAGLLIYKLLKSKLVRERPFFTHPNILLGTAPLDKFSFPSGHTLHASGFSLVALSYYPELAMLLLPFSLLTAMSRIILGLHYPSDVLAGGAIGASIALVTFALL